MVYQIIKEGYNKVTARGDNESIKVTFTRSSTDVSTWTITRNPGIIERLNWGIPLFVPMTSEEQYRNRIKNAVKKALDLAHHYDLKDATESAYLAFMKSYTERRDITLADFIATLREKP